MLMKQEELLEKATAKFKEEFGSSHTDLGFNFIKFYKNSVLFAKSTKDIENFKKSDSIATKAILLTCLTALFSLIFVCTYFFKTQNDEIFPTLWAFIIIFLYIIAIFGNCYFFQRYKHYENLYKNNIFLYRL